jgi:hypothetical protein
MKLKETDVSDVLSKTVGEVLKMREVNPGRKRQRSEMSVLIGLFRKKKRTLLKSQHYSRRT